MTSGPAQEAWEKADGSDAVEATQFGPTSRRCVVDAACPAAVVVSWQGVEKVPGRSLRREGQSDVSSVVSSEKSLIIPYYTLTLKVAINVAKVGQHSGKIG